MLVQRDILRSIADSLLKFHKWFKHGLKAQQLLAQGIALGFRTNTKKSP